MLKSLQLALVVLLAGSSCQPLRAAPWWENYGEKENYLCSNQVVLQCAATNTRPQLKTLLSQTIRYFGIAR